MKKKTIVWILALLVILGSLGAAFYFYSKYQSAQNALNNPEEVMKKEAKEIADKISKFMDVPTDEEPNLATVLDKEKLKDQSFFARAENGDKVLIYTKAAKAILYRVSSGRVIEVAPISMTQPSVTPTPEITPALER